MAMHGPVALLQLSDVLDWDPQPRKVPLEHVEDWGAVDLEQGRNKAVMLPCVSKMTQDISCALIDLTLLSDRPIGRRCTCQEYCSTHYRSVHVVG